LALLSAVMLENVKCILAANVSSGPHHIWFDAWVIGYADRIAFVYFGIGR